MSCRNPSWAPGWAALQGSGETCGAPTRVVRFSLGARSPSRFPRLGTEARSCFPHALRRAVHDRNACSTDICSLRLLAHFQSEHPRLDPLSARKERMNAASFTLGRPLRWTSLDIDAPPGAGARGGSVVFSLRSSAIGPLTLRRRAAHVLVFSTRAASAPPRSLPPSRRETVWAFPIQSAFRRPGDPGEPGSFVKSRSGFSPDPPPRTTRLRFLRLTRYETELAEDHYPPGFLLVGAAPEAARRPSTSAAQSTRGHSPQATSPLLFRKSVREAPKNLTPAGANGSQVPEPS